MGVELAAQGPKKILTYGCVTEAARGKRRKILECSNAGPCVRKKKKAQNKREFSSHYFGRKKFGAPELDYTLFFTSGSSTEIYDGSSLFRKCKKKKKGRGKVSLTLSTPEKNVAHSTLHPSVDLRLLEFVTLPVNRLFFQFEVTIGVIRFIRKHSEEQKGLSHPGGVQMYFGRTGE